MPNSLRAVLRACQEQRKYIGIFTHRDYIRVLVTDHRANPLYQHEVKDVDDIAPWISENILTK